MDKKIIAIDFDGTIVAREDNIDETSFALIPNAKEVLDWIFKNFYVILWTCRDGVYLQNAINFLSLNSINFHTINQNIPGLEFETSNKVFADFYIDDRASFNGIDWLQIKDFLTKSFLEPKQNDIRLVKKVVEFVVGE